MNSSRSADDRGYYDYGYSMGQSKSKSKRPGTKSKQVQDFTETMEMMEANEWMLADWSFVFEGVSDAAAASWAWNSRKLRRHLRSACTTLNGIQLRLNAYRAQAPIGRRRGHAE